METSFTNMSLAIHECIYNLQKKSFTDLIIAKAKRLKSLEAIDLFSVAEKEAENITWQIKYLTDDLQTLYGFKIFTDNLEKAYHKSIEQIFDAYHYRNFSLEMELYQLHKSHSFLGYQHLATIDSLLFMTDIAIKKTDEIISLKQKQ